MAQNRREFVQALAGTTLTLKQHPNPDRRKADPPSSSSSVWFTDMNKCRPENVYSDNLRRAHWRAIGYSTAERKGTLVYAGPSTQAPELTLPLGLRGWHTIYVGLWGGYEVKPFAVKLKLTGARCFQTIYKEINSVEALEEAFYTHVDLSGRDLVIAQSTHVPANSAGIAYVRCEPLSQNQIEEILRDRRQRATKRILAYNDGEGMLRHFPTSKEDIWENIEPLAESDYAALYWGIVGEHVGHPTKVARAYGEGIEEFSSEGLRRQHASLQLLLSKGINPLVAAMEYAQSIGLKFHLYQRMGAFAAFPPFDEVFGSRYYQEHPEFRCRTADGRTVMRLSMAYAEVRAYMIAILREAAEFGLDGINLNFKRGAPFVVYEEPIISEFKREYGHDPRELDEWDQEWLRFRSRFITRFMRELRLTLDQVGKRLGKRLELSATTHPSPQECLLFGVDLATWIKEGLVDRLMPMGFSHGGPEVDFDFYLGLTKGTHCGFYPHLPFSVEVRDGTYYNTKTNTDSALQFALRYYGQGASGLSVWDSYGIDTNASMGPISRRLGHLDEIGMAVKSKQPHRAVKLVQLESVGGHDVTVRVPEDEKRIYPRGTPHHAWTGL
jgi:hypothetical protein